ncbi:MAG: hypothetical protein M5U13_04995 [Thermoanaerobaculia bacterium]|nr:hypothetical protein [Thermoanaerobaculia bacterium]
MLEVLGWITLVVLGIAVLVVLIAALPLRSRETPSEAADTIDRFLAGQVSDWEWDDFTCIRARDPVVQSAKQRVREIETRHGCSTPPAYVDDAGQLALREVATSLRGSAA